MNKKQVINIVASLCALAVNFAIGFFLSPFIIKTMGVEAYGFISLANNFVSYFSIITIALNSMANRFVSVNIYQNNMREANKYYSSVTLANIMISVILFVPVIVFCLFIDKVITVPIALVLDVKLLFCIIFINFFISIATSMMGIGYFVRNKLYLSSIRNIVTILFKAIMLILLFTFLVAKVYYLAIATTVVTLITVVWDVLSKRKLLPELKLRKNDFSFNAIKVLLAAGVWNLFGQLSTLLNSGLDLLITNVFMSATAMGVLATAKTIPLLLSQIMSAVSGTFAPSITKHYTENNSAAIIRQLRISAICIGLILNVLVAGFIGFGDVFYKLWVPSQDSKLLHILSILTVAYIIISVTSANVYTVFTAYNKIKVNALVSLGCSVLNVIVLIPLLIYTDLGLYAVAGVSTLIAILRNFIFVFPYAAKVVGVKWYTFYLQAVRNVISVVGVVFVFVLIKSAVQINTWGIFLLICALSGVLGYIINAILLFDKEIYGKIYLKLKLKFKK